MSKKLRDGIVFSHTIFIIDEKKPGLPIQTRIIQLIAVLLGCWGSVGTLLETIAIPADLLTVYLAVLICALLVYGLCLIPSYDLVKLFFGFLCYGLFVLSRLKVLENAFYILENKIIDRLSDYYGTGYFQYIAEYETAVRDSTLLAVLVVIPLVAVFTIAIVRSRLAGIAGILLFLPITVSFLFGLIPSEQYLIAYLAAVLYLSQSNVANHQIKGRDQRILLHRINSRAAVLLCIVCLCVFSLFKLIIPKDDYQKIDEIKEAKTKLQTALFNFNINDYTSLFDDIVIFRTGAAAGGLDGGKLGNYDEVQFSKTEQLVITAPLESISEGVYLKGYVGSEYTGDSWEGHSAVASSAYEHRMESIPEKGFSAINQTSRLLMLMGMGGSDKYYRTARMDVDYSHANRKFIYIPYFTDTDQLENVTYEQDLFVAPVKRKKKYSTVFYYRNLSANIDTDNLEKPQIESYDFYEKEYRDYVYDFYTRLPAEGLRRLKQEFGGDTYSGLSMNDKIRNVISYLDDNTSYSLTPGKLPEGKDYVEYFLYENKKGYCAHYATAAVLMLRAMGIPARYVEGYAVGPSDVIRNTVSSSMEDIPAFQVNNPTVNVMVSVKDYNAHAWVEVYFDGYGWVPIDPTPGSNIGYSGWDERESSAYTTPVPTKAPATPTPRPTVTPRPDKPEVTKAPVTVTKNDSTGKSDSSDTVLLTVVILLLIICVITALLLALRKPVKVKYRRANNRKAILLYRNMDKLLAYCRELGRKGAHLEDCEEYVKKHCLLFDAAAFEKFMEIIKKARFSREIITDQELSWVRWFYQQLVNKVYDGLSFRMKLFLRINRVN